MILALKIFVGLVGFLGFYGLVGAWLFSILPIDPEPDDPNSTSGK